MDHIFGTKMNPYAAIQHTVINAIRNIELRSYLQSMDELQGNSTIIMTKKLKGFTSKELVQIGAGKARNVS